MNNAVLPPPKYRTDSGNALAFARAFVEDADQPFAAGQREADTETDFAVDEIGDDDEMRDLVGRRADSQYEE